MEDVLQRAFAPAVMVAASPDCAWIYEHPLLATNEVVTADSGLSMRMCTLPQLSANTSHSKLSPGPDVSSLVKQLRKSEQHDFYHTVVRELAAATFEPARAQAFETIGHPVACILAVSSENPSPISALTQLYQQSYFDCPSAMSADFLRCVWYIHKRGDADADSEDGAGDDSKGPAEDFDTVASQFGPHCFEVSGSNEAILGAINTVSTHSVYPYMHKVLKEWQVTNTARGSRAFGFGKLLKKLVNNGPVRPETNIFFETCREMQPHVASIPARRRPGAFDAGTLDLDMQLRRLADFAFLLKDYKLAFTAYESLRKPFGAEQRWAHLGGCCEMAAISGAITGLGDVGAAVDTALYTYDSRLHLPSHVLRCVLIVCGCLVEYGDQLLAAGLLSTTLIEIDPILGSGDEPAETAMLMERISVAFDKRGWHRKSKLWAMLAEREWARVPA